MSATYRAFSEQVANRPSHTAVIDPSGVATSYQTLDAHVRRIAEVLGSCTPSHFPDRPVVLLCDDGLATAAIALAVSLAGGTLAPLNAQSPAAQLRPVFDALKPSVVIHSGATAHALPASVRQNATLLDVDALMQAQSAPDEARQPVADTPGEHPFILTLSSGTTGLPKPIALSDPVKLQRSLHTGAEFGVDQHDILLCASPFFHSLGQRLTLMPLVHGATLVQLGRFNARHWLDTVARHRVSFTICVSSHLHALCEALCAADPRADTLRALVSSSANIDLATKRRLFDECGFDFYEMFGASEVATATRLDARDAVTHVESVGRPCRDVAIRILDDQHRDVPAGAVGQIAIHSPLAFSGYHGQREASRKAMHEDWFLTGDIGRLDEHGYLYFIDRMSDVINTGGSNVYPSDVEHCLLAVADVDNCLVTGIRDSYLGEAVIAVIQTSTEDTRALERRLRAACREALTPQQQPLAYFFESALPLNAAGKLDRRSLRERYERQGLDLSSRFGFLRPAA